MVGPKARQVIAAVSAGLLLSGMMIIFGFPAASLSQMEKADSVVHFTKEQSTWFVSVTLLMCIPGSIVGSSLFESIGQRCIMVMLTPVLCLSTMIMSAAPLMFLQGTGKIELFLLGCRIVQSALTALLLPVVSVYIYEISDKQLRGTLISLVEVWATLGFLICYVAGCFLSWVTTAWLLSLITFVPSFIGIFASVESPFWMARKGREEEAKAILKVIRCTEEEQVEVLSSVESNLKKRDCTFSKVIKETVKLSNIKAIIASCLSLIMKELGGYVVLSIYVVYIFEQAGVGMGPEVSSVIVGVIRILCNGVASMLLHKYPRRLILFIGNVLIGLATFAMGIFFYLESDGKDISSLSWLPLISLTIHIIGAAGSIGPCTWTIAVEVLPGSVRSMGFGLANMSYALTAFILSKTLLDIQLAAGLQGVFWIFTGGSMGYILLILFYIPETYGKSMKDIEDYWNPPKIIEVERNQNHV